MLEFLANERVAIEIGAAELAKFSTGGSATHNGSATPSVFGQLSAKAQKDYGNQATWDSVVGSILDDLKMMAVPAVAARYGLTVEDVALLK